MTLVLAISGLKAAVPIAWLSQKDMDYLKQMKWQRVDEGKVESEVLDRVSQQKTIAIQNQEQRKRERELAAANAQSEKDAKVQQRQAILARFNQLLEGYPHPEIEQLATDPRVQSSSTKATASQILLLSKEIEERRLNGLNYDITQRQITTRLEQLIDLGIIK